MAYVAIADRDHEIEHHDPTTFITKYIWSQDHKVIAIQYGITAMFVGLVALVLSGMMHSRPFWSSEASRECGVERNRHAAVVDEP